MANKEKRRLHIELLRRGGGGGGGEGAGRGGGYHVYMII